MALCATFTVPGKPVPLERARKGKPTAKRPKGQWFTPAETVAYQGKVKMFCPARLKVGHKGAVSLAVDIYDEEVVVGVTLCDEPAPKIKGADCDNVLKNLSDALEKAGVYVNDRQITHIVVNDRRT